MEKQLFTWESWDQYDTMAFGFNDCTLVVPIGEYPIGSKFRSITFDLEDGKLELYDDSDNIVAIFNLTLQISPMPNSTGAQ